MSAKTYYEKLQDPRWQKLRLEAMQKSRFMCSNCFASDQTLNVHHKDYIKGKEPWEYTLHQLSVLCKSCHENYHNKIDPFRYISSVLDFDGPWDRRKISFIIAGYIDATYESFCMRIEEPEEENSLRFYNLGVKFRELEDKEYEMV